MCASAMWVPRWWHPLKLFQLYQSDLGPCLPPRLLEWIRSPPGSALAEYSVPGQGHHVYLRNVMWWKYICRLRKWLERLKIAKGCLHKHSVRSSVGGWKDEICTKCTLICTFLWRAPWRKHHFLLNSSNIKIYLHCKCYGYILLHPHYSMELFAY